VDQDGDGKVSFEEFETAIKGFLDENLKDLD